MSERDHARWADDADVEGVAPEELRVADRVIHAIGFVAARKVDDGVVVPGDRCDCSIKRLPANLARSACRPLVHRRKGRWKDALLQPRRWRSLRGVARL